jgi:hypothetical protein
VKPPSSDGGDEQSLFWVFPLRLSGLGQGTALLATTGWEREQRKKQNQKQMQSK